MPPIWSARCDRVCTLPDIAEVSVAMRARLPAMFSIAWRQGRDTVEASTAWPFSSFIAWAMAACERWISRKDSPNDCIVR